ncbi:MAG TPA: response regulator transcription factor [Puia sp.]|jgi:two-component system NarL family response regulator
MKRTRILIADDHPLLVDGLKKVLEEMEGVMLLEPVSDGRRLLSSLRSAPADLVLLDLHMPQMDGLEALRVMRTEFPKTDVLVFTNYNQSRLIQDARDLGARGYLLKNSPSHVLKEAIVTVAAGGTWFEEVKEAADTKGLFVDDFMKKYQITMREVEILRLIARGRTSRQISQDLYLSEFTVNAHRRNICRKLEIYTPVGLVNFAREQGLA